MSKKSFDPPQNIVLGRRNLIYCHQEEQSHRYVYTEKSGSGFGVKLSQTELENRQARITIKGDPKW